MPTPLDRLVNVSREISERRGRNHKIALLASVIRQLEGSERRVGVAWLAGLIPQGRIGVGASLLRNVFPALSADDPSHMLCDLDVVLSAVAAEAGVGSTGRRASQLASFLTACTRAEQEWVVRLLLGELRQGANEGLLAAAVAEASGASLAAVQRAWMLSGDLAMAAEIALADGDAGLNDVGLELFRPVGPMLAETADDPADAVGRLGRAFVDAKLDGARIQVHRRGDVVRVWSRNLLEVTGQVPEVVALVAGLACDDVVLDGEVLAFRADGRPLPFQVTLSRFSRKTSGRDLPLRPFFFDLLWRDGTSLLDAPLVVRDVALREVVPPSAVVERVLVEDAEAAEAFFDRVVEAGHEGVMVKDPDSPYEAGHRGERWLKVKPAHALDLVVLAAEWGSGRRSAWLSNLWLGARAPEGGFAMIGKTFKGLTDAVLAWQTEALLAREVRRDGLVVFVRPELVVAVAFNEVQTSTRYESGAALRFARVRSYRPDKSPNDVETLERILALRRD